MTSEIGTIDDHQHWTVLPPFSPEHGDPGFSGRSSLLNRKLKIAVVADEDGLVYALFKESDRSTRMRSAIMRRATAES